MTRRQRARIKAIKIHPDVRVMAMVQFANIKCRIGIFVTGSKFVRTSWNTGSMKQKYFVPATNFSDLSTLDSISQTEMKSMRLQKKNRRLSTLKKYVLISKMSLMAIFGEV